MNQPTLTATLLITIAMAAAGFVFSLAYFALLRKTAILFAAGRGWSVPLALTLGRFVAVTILLGAAAKLGATSLLAAFAGFLLARALSLRAARRAG
ncbi:MAG: ATP synthase subunit I [Beijerinckiaceae bacterium]